MVAQTPIGKDVEVEYLRKGQRKTAKVALGRLAEDEDQPKAKGKEPPRNNKGKQNEKQGDGKGKQGQAPAGPKASVIGLTLTPITDELRTKYGLAKTKSGLVVLEVDPASPAAEKGIKVGDVVVEAAQQAVSSIEDLNGSIDKMREANRKAVLLRLEDGKGDTRFVAVAIQ